MDDEVRALRYRLLYSVAAAMADSAERKAIGAVFVVQELHSPGLDSRKLRQNAGNWTAFLRRFSYLQVGIDGGKMNGKDCAWLGNADVVELSQAGHRYPGERMASTSASRMALLFGAQKATRGSRQVGYD